MKFIFLWWIVKEVYDMMVLQELNSSQGRKQNILKQAFWAIILPGVEDRSYLFCNISDKVK